MSFFCPDSGETHRWPNLRFIHLTSHPPCCILWFLLLYACVAFIILSFLSTLGRTGAGYLNSYEGYKNSLFSLCFKPYYSILVLVTCGIISLNHYVETKSIWRNWYGVFWCEWNIFVLVEFLVLFLHTFRHYRCFNSLSSNGTCERE